MFLKFNLVIHKVSKSDLKVNTPNLFRSSCFILISLLEFFTPVLLDGFSLKFKGQQVSSCLQESSQYFGRFK